MYSKLINLGYISLFNLIVKWSFRWRIRHLNIVRLPWISTQFIRYQHNTLLCNSLQWWFDPIPGHGLIWWGCVITLIAHITLGKNPLDKWTARRIILYNGTTRNTHKIQIFMLSSGFELTIPSKERPQNHSLDRTVTDTGALLCICTTYYFTI